MDNGIKCINYSLGCRTDIKKEDEYERHVAVCGYNSVQCPDECGMPLIKKNMVSHLTSECPKRGVMCIYCKRELFERDLKDHQSKCDLKRVTCEFCETFGILNQDLEKHYEECEQKPRDCPMKIFGCKFQGIKSDLDIHVIDISLHFPKIVNTLKKMQNEVAEKNKELNKIKTENVAIKKRLLKLETLHNAQSKASQDIDHPQNAKAAPIEKVETKPIVCLSTRNTWKIQAYGNIRRNEVPIIWSNVVYSTYNRGYHFNMNLMIPKRDPKKNVHFGLFVAFQKGEYDDQLRWPFPHTLIIGILNQRTNQTQELCRINYNNVPNDHKPCFNRPEVFRNKKVGNPSVLSLNALEDPKRGLLMNDSIIFVINCE